MLYSEYFTSQEFQLLHTQLTNYIDTLQSFYPFENRNQSEEEKELDGCDNQVRIEKLPVIMETYDPEENFDAPPLLLENTISVVLLIPKWEIKHLFLQGIEIAFAHLRERLEEKNFKQTTQGENENAGYHSVPKKFPPFLANFLYFGNHGKVSIRSNGGNFLNWINENLEKLTPLQIKHALTGLLIVVNDFHSRQLVHRDIKLENILINDWGNSICPELADPDLIHHENNSRSTAGTLGYIALECRSLENRWLPDTEGAIDDSCYQSAEKKAVDCYAVGHSIEQIYHCLKNKMEEADRKNLKKLYQGLKNPHPYRRLTIKKAMKSPYFGKTKEERNDWFEGIQNKYARNVDIYFDSWLYRESDYYPKFDNAFFLSPCKNLLMELLSLKNQLKFILKAAVTHLLNEDDVKVIIKKIEAIKLLLADELKKRSQLYNLFHNIELNVTQIFHGLHTVEFKKTSLISLLQNGDISFKKFQQYFLEETPETSHDLLRILRGSRDKAQDLKCALTCLNHFLKTSAKPEETPLRQLLESFKTAIENTSYFSSETQKSLVTELVWRILFFVQVPSHINNRPDGVNVCQALTIANIKQGGFIRASQVGDRVSKAAVTLLTQQPVPTLVGERGYLTNSLANRRYA
ncbi:MAG TPA: hypothetical protein VLI69_00275 [Gammaproteobacteria bacterium]|nr:hypothetical protein [Gammaproteobacteria bacterium]